MKLGMGPRRLSRVCIFTAALVVRNVAQGNTDRHRSMVVEGWRFRNEMENKRMEMELPILLVSLMDEGLWPKKIFNSQMRKISALFALRYLSDEGVEFWDTAQNILDYQGSQMEMLFEDADTPQKSEYHRVQRGSLQNEPVELPWLDVEQAIFIGQPLEPGVDVFILLDYRSNPADPRVIVNVMQPDPDNQLADPIGRTQFWREVAPTFFEFAERVLEVTEDHKSQPTTREKLWELIRRGEYDGEQA